MILSDTSKISIDLARKKIDEIYAFAGLHQQQLTSFGFSRGFLGLSVLSYLYALHSQENQYSEEAEDHFNQACNMIDGDFSKSYPQDFVELGTVTQFLFEAGVLKLDPNVFLSDIDNILLRKMRHELSQKNIGGFVNGAIGYGLYFLERFSYDEAKFRPILIELINGIAACTIHGAEGCYWISHLISRQENTYLTMPHGSAAVLIFLAKAIDLNVIPAGKLELLAADIIRFIKYHEVHGKVYHFIDIVQKPHQSRLALCYGDMGVGYALLRAGKTFRNDDWYKHGFEILTNCASRREPDETGVKDASVLFGATGLALMFDHIYTLTTNDTIRNAKDFWYAQILRFDTNEDGYAGYKAAYNQWHAHTNLAFSEGIIGIACGLIKALHPKQVNLSKLIWLI